MYSADGLSALMASTTISDRAAEGGVALLCHMWTDYESRVEQQRGPQPSEQMAASIGPGLHLSLDDELFRLAGHTPPPRGGVTDHVPPGMLRIFDRLTDTPGRDRERARRDAATDTARRRPHR